MSQEILVRLERIRDGSYDAPSDVWELTQRLLEPSYLGHPDPRIRDKLVYPTLHDWITKAALSDDQTRAVLTQLLDDNHLFFELGQTGSEAVLVRSFSLLQIAAALDRQQQHPFLSAAEVHQVVPVLLRYLEGEKDWRGYDARLGWLHAAAHVADVVGTLAACDQLSSKEVKELLAGLQRLAGLEVQTYTCGEDERIAAAISHALLRVELATNERLSWLDSFRIQVQTCAELEMPEDYARFMNLKHTLRALYFLLRCAPKEVGQPLCGRIEQLLLEFESL